MSDLISRQAAIDAIYDCWIEGVEEDIIERIKNLPPVTQKSKTGRWKKAITRIKNHIMIHILQEPRYEVLYKRFLTYVVCFICEFAKENGMSQNKTLEAVANDILSMIKIGDFDEWEWK